MSKSPARGPASRRSAPQRSAKRAPTAPGGPSSSRTPTDPTVVCRLRVALPESVWVGVLSRRYPEAQIGILARLELDGGRMLTDVRIDGPEPRPGADELRGLPSVRSVEQLSSLEGPALYRVVHTDRGFLPLLARAHVLRQFPFPILNGYATWTIVSPESRLRRLIDSLRRRTPSVAVEAVHARWDAGVVDSLTPRQREVLHEALKFGYFEVPRRISLTELAARMDLSKSTLSEALAIIERKLLRDRIESRPPVASPESRP